MRAPVPDAAESRAWYIVHIVKQIAKAEVALGEFEQLVLLALVRLGPDAYGATIKREIEVRTGRELAISAVYITLDRLEVKGLVRSRIGEPTPQRGGRRRKHFVILPAGRRAITHACRAFGQMVEGLGLL
jgi:PadR family transcriptional regulator, regulatory protein PadR